MAAELDVDVSDAVTAFRRYAALVGNMAGPLDELGDTIQQEAGELTPVLTGFLLGTLTHETSPTEVVVRTTGAAEYDAVQNYGWPGRNIAAAGYLDPGPDSATEDQAGDLIDSELTRLAALVGLT